MSRKTCERRAAAWAAAAAALMLAPAAVAQEALLPGTVVESRLLPRAVKAQVAALVRAESGMDRAASPGHALTTARSLLQRARVEGDPRLLGYARAALARWWDREDVPIDAVVLQATIEQAQHHFQPARARLERVLPTHPLHVQGWLTLATIRAVQGDLASARQACVHLASAAPETARLCALQIDVQTGEAAAALRPLRQLAASRDAGTRTWAASLLGETLARLGRHDEAIPALRTAAASGALYDRLALADALLATQQHQGALAALRDAPAADAVLLRRYRALQPSSPAAAQALLRELRARFAAVPETDAKRHARERALLALWSKEPPAQALPWAAVNLAQQREPIDLRIAAEAARAASDTALLSEVRRHVQASGLQDTRLHAALGLSPGALQGSLTP